MTSQRSVCAAWLLVLGNVINVRSLPAYTPPYVVLLHSENAYVQHGDDGGLTIMCLKHLTMSEAVPPLNNITKPVIGIDVSDCKPPNSTYIEALEALNINPTKIESLSIHFKEIVPLPPRDYMSGLKLRLLFLRMQQGFRDLFRDAPDFLEPLENVAELVVSGDLRIPRLPESMRVKKLKLHDGSSIKEWGNCRELETLDVSSDEVPKWPEECRKVRELEVRGEDANGIFSSLSAAAPYLRSVKASSCSIHSLPMEFLAAAQRLEFLDISKNELYDSAFIDFPLMSSLKTLNVGSNLYNGGFLKYVVPKVPALHRIDASHNNNFRGICSDGSSDFEQGLELIKRSSIKEVSVFYSRTNLNCFKNTHFKNLTLLEFGYMEISKLKVLDLPTSDAENLTVDFYMTAFEELLFTQEDYDVLRKENELLASQKRHRNHLILKTSYININCDCVHGWLARALRDFPKLLSVPNLPCNRDYGIDIMDEDPKKLECDKWTESECMLTRPWGMKEVDAECTEQVLPEFKYPLRGLNVSGCGLTAFYDKLPSTVQWIDYRNNRLSSANATVVSELFKNGRRVWLEGNEIICDCENSPLLDALQEHSELVEDYETLKCIATEEPISSISTAVLCQTALKASMATLAVLLLVIVFLLMILRRYADEIRMFLFTRGWCLACLSQEDLDDKPYDAFISYAHEDDTFVRETLLPGLEEAEEKYRICIHYRDWRVGDWIPESIMKSVKDSKRTLIVLSRSFVESAWSALEFKYAKLSASQYETRVLIIILDDVLSTPLDPELRAYLTYNTYLTCDDPWFWEKLKYAMPHRSKKKKPKPKLNDNYTGNVVVNFPNNSSPLSNNITSISEGVA